MNGAALYACCPECHEDALTVNPYPKGCGLDGAVMYCCMNADCGWGINLDREGRPFDYESLALEGDLELLRAGIEP